MKVDVANLDRVYRVSHPAPDARGPAKLFRRRVEEIHAVRDLSFQLDHGAALGYIGMNGAGKSTTLKMLTGVLAPSSGSVRLDGLDPLRARGRLAPRIGFLSPLKGHLWWDLPAPDTFELIARMYDLDRSTWRGDVEQLVAELDFAEHLLVPVRQLSTGNRVKAELICTLMPRPDLLILDEPTIGLDLLAKEAIHRVLRTRRAESDLTMVLTSHDLHDVEALCDEIMIIDHGRVIYQGTTADIRARWGASRQVHVEYSEPVEPLEDLGIDLVEHTRLSATYRFDAREFPTEAVRSLLGSPAVVDLRVEASDLEQIVRDVYLHHTDQA